jgi:molybdopterin adenylyltransferase
MIRVGILTISDRSFRREREDLSGPSLVARVKELGWDAVKTGIVPDEFDQIKAKLLEWSTGDQVDIILTTGGTGFAPRDITPEATLAVVERQAPGISEAMRSASLLITPHAMLSRATAGIKDRVLIVNFPGSPKAALENLAVISVVIPHAVELLHEAANAEQGHKL